MKYHSFCPQGVLAWQGSVRGRGGMHARGCAWQGVCVAERGAWWGACVAGGMHGWGRCMTGEMATKAGSTHPTGMHSFDYYLDRPAHFSAQKPKV